MALPFAAPDRQLKHRRSVDVEIYRRSDGMWDVDATLRDVRSTDTPLASGVRRAGDPIHSMLLRLVVDARFTIHAAGAETSWMPHPGVCDRHGDASEAGDAYGRLVGLNLVQGFRAAVKERLGGLLGCTHLTELTQVLPTAVIQAFAGEVLYVRGSDGGAQPFQLDRCHALRTDGAVVQEHYPRWYRRPAAAAGASPSPTREGPIPSTTRVHR